MSAANTVQFSVRAARPGDFDTVQATAEEVLPDLASDESRDAFSTNVLNWRRTKRSVKVAEVDGQVVGHVSLGPYRGKNGPILHSACVTLHQVAVRGDYQGHGIGQALLAEALKTAKGFETGIIFAAVNDDSAPFYEKHGWTVGEAGEGFAFIEQEKVEDSDRTRRDVQGLLDKATTPRGGNVNLSGGFNRVAFLVLDQNEIRLAFHFPLSRENPGGHPLTGLVDKVCSDQSLIHALPLSVLLLAVGEATRVFGKARARVLADVWLRESGEAQDVPRRLGPWEATPVQIFDELFESL